MKNKKSGDIRYNYDSEREPDRQSQPRKKHKAGHFAALVKDILNSYLLTVISILAAVVIIVLIVINRGILMEEYDRQIQNAIDGVETSEVLIPENKNIYELSETEVFPGTSFPDVDAADPDGRPTVNISRGEDGKIVSAVYYSYDETGALRAEDEYLSSGYLNSRTVYPADGDGDFSDYSKVIITVNYDKQRRFDGYNVSCFDGDIETKKINYSSGGIMEQYSFPEYDEAGRIIKETFYSSRGMLSSHTDYGYDGNGNNTSKIQYDEFGKEAIREVFFYDEFNRVIRDECYIASVCRSFSEYYYDEAGTRTKYTSTLVNEAEMIYDRKQVEE